LAPIFSFSTVALKVAFLIGFFTALTAAASALTAFDIKKIIAYSTCSQLGYIIIACGLAEFSISYAHLLNHAFFKALLFLTAGIIIHSNFEEQDIRRLYVGLSIPNALIVFVVSSIALIGLPFYSGFYPKEAIILSLQTKHMTGTILFVLLLVPTILTIMYSVRLFYYLFLRKARIQIHKTQSL